MSVVDTPPLPPSLACVPNIPLSEQTLEQLRQEHAWWQAKVEAATEWGAAIGVAAKFASACEREIQRRQSQ